MSTQTTKPAATPKKKQSVTTQIGVVESDKRDKTRRVSVRFAAPHPKYGKFVANRTVLHIHDEKNESRLGDRVEITPCRPISKTKTWRLLRIVERAPEL